ncbi:MAG: hypothetical protein EAZ36_06530 [Verrucomicrobia bacterium]|nr:MAG: hypothetical protein EAZ36_06530 [Verrucomicrobiota bacterium]
MHRSARLFFSLLPLAALFFTACSSSRVPSASAPAPSLGTVSSSPGSPSNVQPVVVEGANFRYVERAITSATAEAAPYWLTGFDNSGRARVLPTDNQGVALVLQAPVAVPKLVIESQKDSQDRIHIRILNRGARALKLEISCSTRSVPIRRHATIDVPIKAVSMLDLAIDAPSADREKLVILVR